MPKKAKKTFVVDTNVLLHDYKCIYNFEENDVVIPIVVLEDGDLRHRALGHRTSPTLRAT